MNKKIAIFSLVFIILIAGVWFWFLQDQKIKNNNSTQVQGEDSKENIQKDADLILFYGKQCSACKILEKFIEENKIDEKVQFSRLEVWYDKDNANFFLEKADECGYSKERLGVPFLYARGQCFSGTPDIEEFFKKETGI